MWVEGRQGTGYFKYKILSSKKFKFDIYLLKYPLGSSISMHRDPVPEGEHRRLNIVLNKNYKGGDFYLGNDLQKGRVFAFSPSKRWHGLTSITKGTRYVLSVGWIKQQKDKQ